MYYLTAEEVVEINKFVLDKIKIKKADRSKLLNAQRLSKIIDGCKELDGDNYDKAAYLLSELVTKHPFASGNRRTAFVATKEFIVKNNEKFGISDDPGGAKVMLGIREGFYTTKEIKEWIKNGKIREFRRH